MALIPFSPAYITCPACRAYDTVASSSQQTWEQAKQAAQESWEATKDKSGEVCALCASCPVVSCMPRGRRAMRLVTQLLRPLPHQAGLPACPSVYPPLADLG